MSQALVISDNEILNGIYTVNLEAYLGVSVTVQENHEQAIKLFELNPNFDLIISLCFIDGDDTASVFYQYLEEKGVDIPMIVVGRQSDLTEDQVHILTASYNVKSLLRMSARILEITAEDMMNKPVPNQYPIPVKLFFHMKTSPCDVYYRVKKGKEGFEYFKILAKDGKVWPRIKKYLDEGVRTLFIESSMRLEFVNLASGQVMDELQRQDATAVEKMEAIESGIEIVADQLTHSEEITDELVQMSNACMEQTMAVISEMPNIKKLLSAMMSNKSGYQYSHSILTAYIASKIVKQLSWGGESHLEKLNFVLYFHDIFLTGIYLKYPDLSVEEELLFDDRLNDKEKEIVLNHAKMACDIVKEFPKCPMGADQIIAQHHGMTSGEGFATKFRDEISPLAKVILITEAFVEDMYRAVIVEKKEHDRDNTLSTMRDRFYLHTYTKIIDALEQVQL